MSAWTRCSKAPTDALIIMASALFLCLTRKSVTLISLHMASQNRGSRHGSHRTARGHAHSVMHMRQHPVRRGHQNEHVLIQCHRDRQPSRTPANANENLLGRRDVVARSPFGLCSIAQWSRSNGAPWVTL